MKQFIIVLCMATILMTVATACASGTAAITSVPTPSAAGPVTGAESDTGIVPTNPVPDPQTGAGINVDELMKNPESYTGSIRVEGVVSTISPGQQSLGLIDSREFAECGVTTCALFILPVQWSGSMPSVRDTVQVVGQVQKSNGKFVFVAKTLESANNETR